MAAPVSGVLPLRKRPFAGRIRLPGPRRIPTGALTGRILRAPTLYRPRAIYSGRAQPPMGNPCPGASLCIQFPFPFRPCARPCWGSPCSWPPPAPLAAGSPAPDPATTGSYTNWPNCHFGHYRLQRTAARVSLELTSFVDSAACLEHTPARAMFVLPPAYRPPMTIIREVAVAPGPRFLTPEAGCRAGCRLRLRVEPDGRVHYEPATPSFHADQLSELTPPERPWLREEVRVLEEQLSEGPEGTDWGWGDTPGGEFTLSVQWGTTPRGQRPGGPGPPG